MSEDLGVGPKITSPQIPPNQDDKLEELAEKEKASFENPGKDTLASVIAKHLFDPNGELLARELAVIGALALSAYAFIQDNSGGLLATPAKLGAFLLKCGVMSLFVVALLILYKWFACLERRAEHDSKRRIQYVRAETESNSNFKLSTFRDRGFFVWFRLGSHASIVCLAIYTGWTFIRLPLDHPATGILNASMNQPGVNGTGQNTHPKKPPVKKPKTKPKSAPPRRGS